MMNKNILKTKNGFTLVEALITIFIFGLGAIMVSLIIMNYYKIYNHTFRQTTATIEASKAIKTMLREIREAATAQNGAYVIATTTDYEFSFYSDVDRDNDVELVRYYIDGTRFLRSTIEPTSSPPVYLSANEKTSVISIYVRNGPSVFKYYDHDGSELLTTPIRRKDTEMMQLRIVINVNPSDITLDYELITNVQLRNLKSNL